VEDRAVFQGNENLSGGEAGFRLGHKHDIRAFPGRLLCSGHHAAVGIEDLRGQNRNRAAVRLHPRLQGYRKLRRQLYQQRDRHLNLQKNKRQARPI